MSMFRRFLVKNLIAFLVLFIVLIYASAKAFLQYTEALNTQHQSALAVLLADNNLSSKQFIKSIKNSFDYATLKVESVNLNNDVQYGFEKPQVNGTLTGTLLDSIKTQNQLYEVENAKQDLRIRFVLASEKEYLLFDKLVRSILLVALVFALLITIADRLVLKRVLLKNVNWIVAKLRMQTNENDDLIDSAKKMLPKEFARLVVKLDEIREEVKETIREWKVSAENYQLEATRDNLTGLPNRASFLRVMEQSLTDGDSQFGVLAICRATELQHINKVKGYDAGDQYIKDVGLAIERVGNNYQNVKLFRLNGSDFALIVPNITIKESEKLAQNLFARFTELQKMIESNGIAYTGIVSYKSGQELTEILALADTGISMAQTKNTNGWHIQNDKSVLNNVSARYGNQNWKIVIDDVIENQNVRLFHQPVQPAGRSNKMYSEILARFTNLEGDLLPTGSFVAMAEKIDKIIDLDKLIIEATIETIHKKNLQSQSFGINITARSAHDEKFCIWLERRLLRDSFIATRLVFEIAEFGMQQNLPASQRFIKMLHRAGSRVTVERFGAGFTSFKFFRDIKPDFIKIDGSYSRKIDDDKTNQYFLRVIVDLAHRLGVSVIAESVETQEEKHMLEQLLVDGTQGYFISKPSEL
ncbi:EAL domain-containing protein [Gayadomonas joobiniege]|uniref:EAL domain-containing protein n=1 Tax=Gayadomonas joobiniege TaxID=1234606 RepID=UPI00037D20D5|nr:EAL domain-containing protein [Gayadomonas joobiniege]